MGLALAGVGRWKCVWLGNPCFCLDSVHFAVFFPSCSFPFPGLEHHLPHLLLIGADWISSYKRVACRSSYPLECCRASGVPLGPLFLSLDLCLPWGFSCLTFVLSFPVPAAPSSLLLSSASLVCPPTAPLPLSNLFEIKPFCLCLHFGSSFWVPLT